MAKGVMVRKVVVLACILSLLVSAAVLAGCGGGSSSSQTPEQVMQAFFTAVKNKDVNTAWNMLSSDSQKTIGSKSTWKMIQPQSGSLNYTIGKTTVNGNEATVNVTISLGTYKDSADMPLVKENGVWKVVRAD